MNQPGAFENPHAGQGMVLLDIGDGFGALVLTAPATLAGREVEICPAGRRAQPPDHEPSWWGGSGHPHGWPHVAVIPRATATGTTHAAVFPSLREGSYEIWARPDGPLLTDAEIRSGRVTQLNIT